MSDHDFHLVFLDAATYGDASLDRFKNNWECTIYSHTSLSKIGERIVGNQVAIINKVELDRSILNSPSVADLKLIVVAATGTNNVDLETAKKRGIQVCNVPGYATQSVAQFTMALILELASRVGRYGEIVRGGAWEKSPIFTRFDFSSVELSRKKLGIIGYGNIGQAVAKMAHGFGMEILLSVRPGGSGSLAQGRMLLGDLLAQSDFVTLHCPLTPQTRHLIDSFALASMKKTAFLINTARGGIVDEIALIESLKIRQIAGAALDVTSEEPPSPQHPIIEAAKELDNLIVTPHCAWTAYETRKRLMDEIAENIVAFQLGQERNRVV